MIRRLSRAESSLPCLQYISSSLALQAKYPMCLEVLYTKKLSFSRGYIIHADFAKALRV